MDRDLDKKIQAAEEAIKKQDSRIAAMCKKYKEARAAGRKSDIALRERALPIEVKYLIYLVKKLSALRRKREGGVSRKEEDGSMAAQLKELQAVKWSSKIDADKSRRSKDSGREGTLHIPASDPKEATVVELLRRIDLNHSGQARGDDLYTPCCYSAKELPQLPPELRASSSLELTEEWPLEEEPEYLQQAGLGWLTEKLRLDGTVVIPVHGCEPWMKADFLDEHASMDPTGIDFLIAIDAPLVAELARQEEPAKPEQLRKILKYVIGAYQLSPESRVGANGVLGLWAKAVMQAIALNCMAEMCGARWWIPVFAGDLNRNLVLHLARGQHKLHAAAQPDPQDLEEALRFMRALLEKVKKEAAAGQEDPLLEATTPVKACPKKRPRHIEEPPRLIE